MTTLTESQTLKLKSIPESINIVETLIDDIRNDFNVSDDLYGNILITLTEAVNNAIFHGNKCAADKEVSLFYSKQKDSLMFSVSDEGKGFDYYNIPDPTAPENIDKPNGRGVFLMKSLCDQLIFSDNGRTVELQFNIHS